MARKPEDQHAAAMRRRVRPGEYRYPLSVSGRRQRPMYVRHGPSGFRDVPERLATSISADVKLDQRCQFRIRCERAAQCRGRVEVAAAAQVRQVTQRDMSIELSPFDPHTGRSTSGRSNYGRSYPYNFRGQYVPGGLGGHHTVRRPAACAPRGPCGPRAIPGYVRRPVPCTVSWVSL